MMKLVHTDIWSIGIDKINDGKGTSSARFTHITADATAYDFSNLLLTGVLGKMPNNWCGGVVSSFWDDDISYLPLEASIV